MVDINCLSPIGGPISLQEYFSSIDFHDSEEDSHESEEDLHDSKTRKSFVSKIVITNRNLNENIMR
jgi:hypothetical protein